MGVCGGTLDATVDALAVSGVTLELVVAVALEGFLSAERVGGGKRREGERGGECEREDGGHRELWRACGARGGVEELGEDTLR